MENDDLVIKKNGKKKPDVKKRDIERIPLTEEINEYFNNEVKPNLEDAWMDRSKDKIGYEINFTQYFYKFLELRNPDTIMDDIKKLDQEIEKTSNYFND